MIFLFIFLEIISIVLPVLLAVAFFTLIERKFLAVYHRRKGPNVIGLYGLLQAIADGFKLLLKESIFPSNADKILFIIAPILSFTLSLSAWGVICFTSKSSFVDLNLSLLYLLAISAISIYGIIISGWASNSKYAFLGSLRSSAQMISYEVSIGFILFSIVFCTNSFNLREIVEFQENIFLFFPLFPISVLFFISILAETNRHPFDLPEAEAELVSGYNVEYSAVGFTLFFLAEYSNMLIMSCLACILFLGGWLSFFSNFLIEFEAFNFIIKILLFSIYFVIARALLPRLRYDQLMQLGWQIFVPLVLCLILLNISFFFIFYTLDF